VEKKIREERFKLWKEMKPERTLKNIICGKRASAGIGERTRSRKRENHAGARKRETSPSRRIGLKPLGEKFTRRVGQQNDPHLGRGASTKQLHILG